MGAQNEFYYRRDRIGLEYYRNTVTILKGHLMTKSSLHREGIHSPKTLSPTQVLSPVRMIVNATLPCYSSVNPEDIKQAFMQSVVTSRTLSWFDQRPSQSCSITDTWGQACCTGFDELFGA